MSNFKDFCTINGITGMPKTRLVKARVIGDKFSVDECYLRLRHHYHPLALYCHEYLASIEGVNGFETRRDIFGSAGKVLLTNESVKVLVSIIEGLSDTLPRLVTTPVFSTLSTSDNILGVYLGLTDTLFDQMVSSSEVYHMVRDMRNGYHLEEHKKTFPQFDLLKALSIQHPNGDDGVARSMLLLVSQSEIIRRDHATRTFQNLDLKKVLSHESFNMLQHINTHKDNSYLKKFLASDGTYNSLLEIYNASIKVS